MGIKWTDELVDLLTESLAQEVRCRRSRQSSVAVIRQCGARRSRLVFGTRGRASEFGLMKTLRSSSSFERKAFPEQSPDGNLASR